MYGFYDECMNKYGNPSVWRACCNVFDSLNLAAIIDSSILCVHGGLSPDIRTLDQVRTISRAQEVPHEGPFCGEYRVREGQDSPPGGSAGVRSCDGVKVVIS